MAGTSVEVIIPQKLLTHVYGESNSNLTQIRQVGLCIGLVPTNFNINTMIC